MSRLDSTGLYLRESMNIQHFAVDKLRLSFVLAVVVTVVLVGTAFGAKPAEAQTSEAPGAPGEEAVFTQADKKGFGTSTTEDSKVW